MLSSLVILFFLTHSHGSQKRSFNPDLISQTGQQKIADFIKVYRNEIDRSLGDFEGRANLVNGLVIAKKQSFRSQPYEEHRTLTNLYIKFSNQPILLWQLAGSHYVISRILEDSDQEERLRHLELGVTRAKQCLDLDPDNPDCWLAYGAILGVYSLVNGIFDTLSHLKEVSEALHRAHDLSEIRTIQYTPEGNTTKTLALLGLSEFYRICPDSWLVKLITGVKGDKIKSFEFSKMLPIISKINANARGRSTICAGALTENDSLIEEGIKILERGLQFEILHQEATRTEKRLKQALKKIGNDFNLTDYDHFYRIGCVDYGNDQE